MPGTIRKALIALFLVLVTFPPAHAADGSGPDSAAAALEALAATAGGRVDGHLAPETGAYDFVRALRGAVLARDDVGAKPQARATAFLRRYGAVVGLDPNERASLGSPRSVLRFERVERDLAGKMHVRFTQRHRKVPVFGAQLIVHMNGAGITSVSGQFVPGVHMSTKPKISRTHAVASALASMKKSAGAGTSEGAELAVYRVGLVEGVPGRNVLAWSVRVVLADEDVRQVWVDAASGAVLQQIPLVHSARDRRVYSPQYLKSNPDLFVWRMEGEADTHVPMIDNLYRFSGQVYDFFRNTFQRDSYDAKGATMRTVYLVNQACPNAYWNGASTNYCPGFDADDVVAHEWGHAYTEYTHGLIYFCQSGALNESYSDIWGETIDLLNGEDTPVGGNVNDKPYPDGQRWLVGEDLGSVAQEALLRDMWDPQRLASPGKVSDPEYVCSTGDGGGVHTNSGVPNHAYAMLVDGKTYNNVTIAGIGLTKAAHIYYQSMTHYQSPTIKFATHEQGLKAACEDLIGLNLRELMTGAASGKRITEADCASVAAVTKAVEMNNPGKQCNFLPMFSKAPETCPGATSHFTETFEDGLSGWTLGNAAATPPNGLGWLNFNWKTTNAAPGGHAGKTAFAPDPDEGSCGDEGDTSGRFWMDSPSVSIPASAANVKLRFKHYMSAEYGADGGNVAVSVNGGSFALLPQTAYVVNGPTVALTGPVPVAQGNTNPKAGEMGWTGANGGDVAGSWGTTIADLAGIANPGDSIVLRFEFGMDGCGGWYGWYVDDIQVYSCPLLPAPEITIKGGSLTQQATSFTLQWTRPSGGVGPDTVQESRICAPLLFDDAESGLDKWSLEATGSNAPSWSTASDKPEHDSTVFFVRGLPAITGTSSTMTWKTPIKVGPGETMLTFSDWHANEGDDQMRVEVSTDGKSWLPVYNKGRADYLPLALVAYETEPLTPQSADLSKFAGQTIRLRFNYVLGADDRAASGPLGWYVDDVKVGTQNWKSIATVPGTSLAIPGRAQGGVYCYRANTSYRMNGRLVPGDFSAPASVNVRASGAAVKGVRRTRQLPATGVGDGMLPAVLLLACAAAGLRTTRRRSRT